MSKSRKTRADGAMLELWRPPQGSGEPVGCLATTFTFNPGLFDEQCLARFLEIESEPDRQDLAFLLERESRLGGIYSGILVDHTWAGVEHSLRWDVLPVRIRNGKQHAKLSLLAWHRRVRIIVASANLTEPGYRTNHEVATFVDLTSERADTGILADALAFLRSLIAFVPGAPESRPEVARAIDFLADVESRTRGWKPVTSRGSLRQRLACTVPATSTGTAARSSLEEAMQTCRGRGASPNEAWIASPFFDVDEDNSRVTSSLCKMMARGTKREIWFCVPAVRDRNVSAFARLAAPKSLIQTPTAYQGSAYVQMLPEFDADKNRRPWHAKMLGLLSDEYSALMIGSSNFTCAGMGVGAFRNAEANLVTIADRESYGREVGQLEAVWPEMETVSDPDAAEWLGPLPGAEEEEQSSAPPLPAGFLSATYRAGDQRQIIVRLEPGELPEDWLILAVGQDGKELLSAVDWHERGQPTAVKLAWNSVQPPEKLLVRWDSFEAFWPLNVDDSRELPPPAQLEKMSADDMLLILAATDPSAAFRAWARDQQPSELFDPELDSAAPIDLDPLQRYDLHATFLHRVRRRARILAQLRSNLQQPVWGRQALEWRLRGLVGVEPLAKRLAQEFIASNGAADEAFLTLADFLIVLSEIEYEPADGALSKAEFGKIFRPFLRELAEKLDQQIEPRRPHVSQDLSQFWKRVLERCHQ